MQRRKLVAIGAGLAVGIGAVAAGGCGEEAKPGHCLSERTMSRTYKGDTRADPNDRATWRRGISVTTHLPAGATGLIVSFAGPNKSRWFDSDPVPPDEAKHVALKIGPRAVAFSTRVQAVAGSAACDIPSWSAFGEPESFTRLVADGATTPRWP